MLYLKSLPLHFFERLVIGQLADQVGHFEPEVFLEFFEGGLGVLDRIVQSCSHKNHLVEYFTFGRENGCDRDGMIDVRGRFNILSALATMLFCRKRDGL